MSAAPATRRRGGGPTTGRHARALLAALSLGAALTVGCTDKSTPGSRAFPVATETDAAHLVRDFFTAYTSSDTSRALTFLCEKSAADQAAAADFIRRSQAPDSPFRVERFEVRKVLAAWDGKAPVFWVEVSFPRTKEPGELLHAYKVRVRQGCIEQFAGTLRRRVPELPAPGASPPATTTTPAATPDGGPPQGPPTPDDTPPREGIIEL